VFLNFLERKQHLLLRCGEERNSTETLHIKHLEKKHTHKNKHVGHKKLIDQKVNVVRGRHVMKKFWKKGN